MSAFPLKLSYLLAILCGAALTLAVGRVKQAVWWSPQVAGTSFSASASPGRGSSGRFKDFPAVTGRFDLDDCETSLLKHTFEPWNGTGDRSHQTSARGSSPRAGQLRHA